MSAALAKQIPALIERFLQFTKPRGGVADLARVVLHLAAQLVLSIDHLARIPPQPDARRRAPLIMVRSLDGK